MNDENNIVISTQRFEELLMCQTELRALYALVYALDPYGCEEISRKISAFKRNICENHNKEADDAE